MSLTPDQAKIIADYTLTDYEQERAPTKRVIGAVPSGSPNTLDRPQKRTSPAYLRPRDTPALHRLVRPRRARL